MHAWWGAVHQASRDACAHRAGARLCADWNRLPGQPARCEFRRRRTHMLVLTGEVLAFWGALCELLPTRPRVVRIAADGGARSVMGLRVPVSREAEARAAVRARAEAVRLEAARVAGEAAAGSGAGAAGRAAGRGGDDDTESDDASTSAEVRQLPRQPSEEESDEDVVVLPEPRAGDARGGGGAAPSAPAGARRLEMGGGAGAHGAAEVSSPGSEAGGSGGKTGAGGRTGRGRRGRWGEAGQGLSRSVGGDVR